MAEPIVIDSHVHVGRTHARWEETRPRLHAAGIDAALLTADPDSPNLDDERALPAALSRPEGPYALWYIGGDPFSGIRRGRPPVPPGLNDYHGVEWHCYFSRGFDYGSSDDIDAAATAQELDSATAREASGVIEAIIAAGLPIRLTENLPTTLALIDRYPDGRFIIPHMGLRNGGTSRVMNALADNPNVYFDTSVVEPNEGMVGRVGWERVLFGSDAPTGDPAWAIRQVRELNLPPEQIAGILGANAQRLFALQ
jgi:hypothetical protein